MCYNLFMKRLKSKIIKLELADCIFIFTIFIVISSFVIFYLVDLQNFLAARNYLFSLDRKSFVFQYQPLFFMHWGRNGGIVEILQFYFLASSIVLSAFIAGRNYLSSKKEYLFWLLMAIFFSLLLIEDAGEFRETFVSYIHAFSREVYHQRIGKLFEFIYLFFLGIFPLYTIFKYGNFLKFYKKTKLYFIISFGIFFLIGLATFIKSLILINGKGLYQILGANFYKYCIKIGGPDLQYTWQTDLAKYYNINVNSLEVQRFIEFHLLDSLIEENIELIGVAAFLAACVSYLILINKKNKDNNNNLNL
jgi:hypothetical protein